MNSPSRPSAASKAAAWSVATCQAWDQALQGLGLPAAVLMEQAARHVSNFLIESIESRENGRIHVLCGPGNNGADGVAAARQLLGSHLSPTVWLSLGPPPPDSLLERQCRVFEALGGRLETGFPALQESLKKEALEPAPSCWVDALFGIGLTRPIEGQLVEMLGAIQAQSVPILAVDTPSGLDCDTGEVLGAALHATWTLSFAAPKRGFFLGQGPDHVGQVLVADLGVQTSLARAWAASNRRFEAP